jgi:hypothetical protein
MRFDVDVLDGSLQQFSFSWVLIFVHFRTGCLNKLEIEQMTGLLRRSFLFQTALQHYKKRTPLVRLRNGFLGLPPKFLPRSKPRVLQPIAADTIPGNVTFRHFILRFTRFRHPGRLFPGCGRKNRVRERR